MELAHEPAEAHLRSAGRRVREKQREVAAREADGVELPPVRLDDVDDLLEDRVASALAELALDHGQLVEGQVRETGRPLDATDALDLEPQHQGEALLGQRSRHRVPQQLRARHRAPLQPGADASAELAEVGRVGDDVVRPAIERLDQRCHVVRASQDDRRHRARAVVRAQPVEELEALGAPGDEHEIRARLLNVRERLEDAAGLQDEVSLPPRQLGHAVPLLPVLREQQDSVPAGGMRRFG